MHKKASSLVSLKRKYNNELLLSSRLPCHCDICTYYSSHRRSLKQCTSQKHIETHNIKNGDYTWFMLLLCSLNRSLDFNVPNTVFWKEGYPVLIVKMKTDNRLVKVRKGNISRHFARRFLSDSQRSFSLKKAQEEIMNPNKYRIEQVEPLRKNDYKAVLRYMGKGCVAELLTEKAIMEIFTIWNSSELKKIASINNCILSLGKEPQIIRVHYPFEEPGKGSMLKQKNQRIGKCETIVKDLIGLIELSTNTRLNKISLEFFTTDEEIWLNNAWNIEYTITNADQALILAQEAADNLKNDKLQKILMLNRLSKYKDEINANKANHIEALASFMDSTIKIIKTSASLSKLTHKPIKKISFKYASVPGSPDNSESKRISKKSSLITSIWKAEDFAAKRKNNNLKKIINTIEESISARTSPCNSTKKSIIISDRASFKWSPNDSSYNVIKIGKKYGKKLKLAIK